MKRRGAVAVAVGGLAGVAGLGAAWLASGGRADRPDVWSLRFPTLDGGELALAELRGRPVLLNFWATWCAPCVVEMPLLARFQRERRDAGWRVVGLALDNEAAVRKFVTDRGVDFAIALGGGEGLQLSRTLGNTSGGLPFSVAFDSRGELRFRRLGVLDDRTLADWAAQS